MEFGRRQTPADVPRWCGHRGGERNAARPPKASQSDGSRSRGTCRERDVSLGVPSQRAASQKKNCKNFRARFAGGKGSKSLRLKGDGKIRDEILEDAAALGGKGFYRPFWAVQRVAGLLSTGSAGDFLPVGWDFRGFQTQIRRWRLIVRLPKSTTSARDHDVSGMAPPFRMMRAHRARIAANMSNMAVPICKKICRPWRTILPAV
jgi:hypothetical protein